MKFSWITLLFAVLVGLIVVPTTTSAPTTAPATAPTGVDKVTRTDAEWRKLLTDEQYYILRRKGTERPFQNAFWNNHKVGTYVCAGCDLELFTSEQKYESGCGWPSFYDEISKGNIVITKDADGVRDELLCARCDGHLGHIFDDGPKDKTGKRYCINSGAMKFIEKK